MYFLVLLTEVVFITMEEASSVMEKAHFPLSPAQAPPASTPHPLGASPAPGRLRPARTTSQPVRNRYKENPLTQIHTEVQDVAGMSPGTAINLTRTLLSL